MSSPPKAGPKVASPPLEPYSYSTIISQEVEGLGQDQVPEEEDDEDEIVYDDDEDEFGLPSLTSMRRIRTRDNDSSRSQNNDTGGGNVGGNPAYKDPGLSPAVNRQRADSSDIAEERGPPMYPPSRKGEGKILRPQYKEILRGNKASPWKKRNVRSY